MSLNKPFLNKDIKPKKNIVENETFKQTQQLIKTTHYTNSVNF